MSLTAIVRRVQPHVPGLIYTGLLMLVTVAAMNNQNNLLFWVMGVMVSVLVISAGASALMMWSFRIRRIDPRHGSVGEPLIVRYALTNRRRLISAFNIHIQERTAGGEAGNAGNWRRLMSDASAWVMHVGPRETVHGEAIFWPLRRGKVMFDRIVVSTTFPFGIVRKSITISQPQHTLIFPMLYQLRRGVLGAISPAGLIGSKVAQHAGAGDDYYGIRELKPGDNIRHVAWKRSARTDEMVVIERTSPSPARIRVILDLTTATQKLHVEPGGLAEARELEERAISLAASILHEADLEGYQVGLTVLGIDMPAISVRRNPWHLRRIMAALASIDLDGNRTPLEAAGRGKIRDAERASLVVVSPDRVQPLTGRENAWYLTARQLESLTVAPIGWDASKLARSHENEGSDEPGGGMPSHQPSPQPSPPGRGKATKGLGAAA